VTGIPFCSLSSRVYQSTRASSARHHPSFCSRCVHDHRCSRLHTVACTNLVWIASGGIPHARRVPARAGTSRRQSIGVFIGIYGTLNGYALCCFILTFCTCRRMLQMSFLPDHANRKVLLLPQLQAVDFRATCFCHKKVIDTGVVCQVCLSSKCMRWMPMVSRLVILW